MKKETKQLTEYQKKYIELEVKKNKEFNEFLSTTKIKVETYKKPNKGGK